MESKIPVYPCIGLKILYTFNLCSPILRLR